MSNTTNTPSQQSKRRLSQLVVAATVVCLAIASSVAHGAESTSQTPQNPSPQPQDSENVDVSVVSYAAEYSVTQQEAKRRLDRIQPIQGILAEIRAHEPVRLAGWGIDHTGTFTGWVWLTGDTAPSSAASSIAAAHSDIEIRTGAVHSRAALLEAQQSLFEDLRGIGPVGRVTNGPGTISEIERITTYTDINIRSNALEIGIDPALASTTPASPLDPADAAAIGPVGVTDEALQTKIAQVTDQLKDHIKVKYIIEDGRGMSTDTSFSGGQRMGGCTAGFAATRGSRRRGTKIHGIITAGHCGSGDETVNFGPEDKSSLTMNGVSLPHVYGWASPTVDAQFNEIPRGANHILKNDYLCHSPRPIYCDVTGTENRVDMFEDYACHAGNKSGVSCGTITSTNFKPTGNGLCISSSNQPVDCENVFIKVTPGTIGRLRACKGDSGGPWYRNRVAYGIHTGHNERKDNCYTTPKFAYFSPIGIVTDFLGVRIITTGDVTIQ